MSNNTTTCYIALGGNLGPVERTFDRACGLMNERGLTVTARSRVLITPAVGSDAGDDFRNAAVEVRTSLKPHGVLETINVIENELGRQRVIHWGPRTLDLDLLLYGDVILNSELLQIPHPGCWYRRFVLEPLVEIAAEVVHPKRNRTIAELFEQIQRRPLVIHVSGGSEQIRDEFTASIQSIPDVRLISDPDPTATMHIWLGSSEANESVRFDSLPAATRCDISGVQDPVSYGQWAVRSMLGD